jgi:hypothetical protein
MKITAAIAAAILLAAPAFAQRADDGAKGCEVYYGPSGFLTLHPDRAKDVDRLRAECRAAYAAAAKEALNHACYQNEIEAQLDSLLVGMTDKEARDKLACFFHDGLPRHRTIGMPPFNIKVPVNTTVTANVIHEQWVVAGGENEKTLGYLYFENGRLVAIQRSK